MWLAANEGTAKSPQPTYRVFHSEHWAIQQGTIKLTSNIKASLLESYHGTATEKYLREKYHWYQETFNSIDWSAIGAVIGKLTTPSRAKHSKLIHSWLLVMTRTAQYAKSTANLCPLCLAVPETQDHIFCCSSPDAIQHRVPAWHRCLETIRTKGKTSRHILDAFDSGSSLFLQLPPRPIPYTTFPVPAIISPSLSSAQEVQHEIGWKNLFRGFFSRTWGATQELYTQHIEKPAGNWTLDNWKRITAAAFLEFGHSLWKFRNDTKFGKDKLEHARIVRTQLEFKVSAQYSSKRYLLPKFHHIFSKPLAE